MIHFLYLLGFAFFTAVCFGIFFNGDVKEKFIHALKVFSQFLIISIILAWVLYFLPWS